MAILQFRLGPLDNNTYLIVDESTGDAAIVDPSFQSETLLPQIRANHWNLRYILNTHAHFDHVVGNAFYATRTDARIALHPADLELYHALPDQAHLFGFEIPPAPEPQILLTDGQILQLGHTPIRVMHTPGHSPGGVTFLVANQALVGDCLFAGSIGRTDLPGGAWHTLRHTLHTRLLALPDDTPVLPGHGPTTTIGTERRHNPYLQEP